MLPMIIAALSNPPIPIIICGNPIPHAAILAMSDNASDDSDRDSPPSDDEGNIFEWAEEHLEDEYWKNDA